MDDSIYLDHNATTPMRAEVVEAMARAGRDGFANPASQHRPGQRARKVVEDAREELAALCGANLTASPADRLVFTSGGTEANNLAILGLAAASGPPPGHLVISGIEHQSVIEPAEHLLESGWQLDVLGADRAGVIRIDELPRLLRSDEATAPAGALRTRLVSVILGNHETGVMQPVAEVVQLCRPRGIPVHTDAVQVAGKRPLDFRGLGVSAMSIAAHKFQGPPGIGALLLDPHAAVAPAMFGGHQQHGLRPGTEPVPLVVGMLTALRLWRAEADEHQRRLAALRDRFESQLKASLPDVVVHGAAANRLPQTSNVAFTGLDGQVLLIALDVAGVACSAGSACASGSTELSPTLRAMGLPSEQAACSLRFSLGATNTAEQIDEAVRRIVRVAVQLGMRAG